MRHFSPPGTAIWRENAPGHYTVEMAPNRCFGCAQEGSTYYLVLPGLGIRKCWNRAEVERACLDFILTKDALDEPDDSEWDVGPSAWEREEMRRDMESGR